MQTANQASSALVGTVLRSASFEAFATALKAAGLVEALKNSGPFTVFAPTNEAFAGLGEGILQDWLKPKSRPKLRGILRYHMLAGRMSGEEIIKSSSIKTLQGLSLTIRYKDGRMHVNNAIVIAADLSCGNGLLHVLDTVLIPR